MKNAIGSLTIMDSDWFLWGTESSATRLYVKL